MSGAVQLWLQCSADLSKCWDILKQGHLLVGGSTLHLGTVGTHCRYLWLLWWARCGYFALEISRDL